MADNLPTVWKADPHTLAKHSILRHYLQAWSPIMTRRAASLNQGSQKTPNREILFVDAFAGPGEYSGGEPGSPAIALNTLASHDVEFPYPIRLVFNERDKKRWNHLVKSLEHRRDELESTKNIILETPTNLNCSDALDELVSESRERGVLFGPALVFLDQFGYSAVSMDLGERQLRLYLPRGFVGRIVISYLGSVVERSRRLLMSCISALVTGASVS